MLHKIRLVQWYMLTTSSISPYDFICQLASPALRGTEKLDLIYTKDQLTFRSFHVWYEYKAASQQVLDSWEDKRMTGFKLTWRIEKPTLMANRGSRVVRNAGDTPNYFDYNMTVNISDVIRDADVATDDYESSEPLDNGWVNMVQLPTLTADFSDVIRNSSEATPEPFLVKMVRLAQYLRVKEKMTEEQILDKVIKGKLQNISILEDQGVCSHGQIKSAKFNETFPELLPLVEIEFVERQAIDKDIMTGFKLFHASVYCPEMDMKLYRFVLQLLSIESQRTLIQSYTNIFHSGVLKGTTSITLAKAFYMDLAATLNLQYGNILLATSTKSQLQAVIDNDGPFFTNNSDLVKSCIVLSTCDILLDIIEDQGKMLSFTFTF